MRGEDLSAVGLRQPLQPPNRLDRGGRIQVEAADYLSLDVLLRVCRVTGEDHRRLTVHLDQQRIVACRVPGRLIQPDPGGDLDITGYLLVLRPRIVEG